MVSSSVAIAMSVIFAVGILFIALEDFIKTNKAATALGMAVILWALTIANLSVEVEGTEFQAFLSGHSELLDQGLGEQVKAFAISELGEHLGDVSATLFFILASMLLVNTVDKYGGFKEVSSRIATNDKRRLLWYISFAAFFFSAFLDNLAASIVIIAILRKLVPDKTDRMKYACMCILACNAGGSWSPIGDVTTLLLWVNGRISVQHQFLSLFLPALFNMLVPLTICHFWLFKANAKLRQDGENLKACELKAEMPEHIRMTVFILGLLSLSLVPVYQVLFGLPAFFGAMIGLVLLWVYTDHLSKNKLQGINLDKLRMTNLFHDADIATILYFLGILMSVGAMSVAGILPQLAEGLERLTAISASVETNANFLAAISGMVSSLVDNVALVAGMLGMYPLGYNETMVADGSFWTFLAYCAVTGGSLLIIGSGTGVTVMGLEKIPFSYYFKRFSALALSGYIAGGLVYLLINFAF